MAMVFACFGTALSSSTILSAVVLVCIVAGGAANHLKLRRHISELEEMVADNYLEDI